MSDLETISVLGGIAVSVGLLGVEYILGKWPFYRNPEKVYIPRRWFFGKPVKPLKPTGTRLHLSPFMLLEKDSEKKPVEISAQKIGGNSQMRFVDQNGLGLDANLQFIVQIYDEEGANKFYWELQKDQLEIARNIIESEVKKQIKDVTDVTEANGEIIKSFYQSPVAVLKKFGSSNLYGKNEKDANNLYEMCGLVLESLVVTDIKPDIETQKILSKRADAATETIERKLLVEALRGERKGLMELAKNEAKELGYKEDSPDYHVCVERLFGDLTRNASLYQLAQQSGTIIFNDGGPTKIIPCKKD